MKKNKVIILVLISFVLGFCLSKIYFLNKYKPYSTINSLQSGVYRDLYFESLRKDGDLYYIKFSKQLEDKKFPPKCYLNNGDIRPNNEEIEGCFMQGRPLQTKEKPDIDLSKEYKFAKEGLVELIYFSDKTTGFQTLVPSNFYEYLVKSTKPPIEYYGDVINNSQNISFKVTIINNEVENISQIYQE